MVVELPQSSSPEEMSDMVQEHVLRARLPVPVMVTHSLSSFVGQKFLESHALCGLVMVCPLSPSSRTGSASRLLERLINPSCTSAQLCLLQSFGIGPVLDPAPLETRVGPPFAGSELWSDIMFSEVSTAHLDCLQTLVTDTEGRSDVTLESGVVPMMVVCTDGDAVAQEADVRAIVRVHGLREADFRTIRGSSRLPMVTSFSAFSEALYGWLDEVC